jgi:hypothetical protein
VTVQKYGKRDGIGVLLYNTKLRPPLVVATAAKKESATNKSDDDNDDKEEDEDDEEPPAQLLYGYNNGSSIMSRVHELLALERPGVTAVRQLQKTQEDVFTGECELDLEHEYGPEVHQNDDADDAEPKASSSLHLALEAAVQAFQTSSCVKQRPGKNDEPDLKYIWILTADPHPTDNGGGGVTASVVENIHDNGIAVSVWPVVTDRSTFDATYYTDTLQMTCPRGETGDDTIDDLVFALEKLTKKIRRVFTAPLVLPGETVAPDDDDGDDETTKKQRAAGDFRKPRLMLDFFTLVRPTEKPKLVPIHQQTGKCVKYIHV